MQRVDIMKIYVKKIMCLLLTCILLAGMLPMTAAADSEAAGNFTVQMLEGNLTDVDPELYAVVGDTVSIPVVVKHTAGEKTYNSFDMLFSYDVSRLELTSKSFSGMSVTESNGRIRVLRYGSDLQVGATAFTLTFKVIKSGKTAIEFADA